MKFTSFVGACSAVVGASLLFTGCAKDQKPTAEGTKSVSEAAKAESPKANDLQAMLKSAKPIESCEDVPASASNGAKVIAGGIHFGPDFTLADKDTITYDKLLADPAAYNGKYIRVTGKVDNVCEKKGCWLTMGNTTSPETMYVKFVDPPEGRLIPMKAQGHEIIAEGTFKVGQVSQEFARHIASEAGASKEEQEKIVGVQKKLLLMKPSVTINGLQQQ